jgi:sulfonate transport system ATP-binding protein
VNSTWTSPRANSSPSSVPAAAANPPAAPAGGLDTQFRGQISVDGKAVSGIGGERGIVFQEHRLFPWLTVAHNIGLGLVNEPLSTAESSNASPISSSWSACAISPAPIRTSSPAAWRSAWRLPAAWWPARASCCSTPFGALDALTRQQMQDELLAIRDRAKITTMLVTHDVEEAIFLADRVVVMEPRPGRIKQVVDIALPHPRQRSSFDFHQLREELLHELTSDDHYQPSLPVQIRDLPLSFIA